MKKHWFVGGSSKSLCGRAIKMSEKSCAEKLDDLTCKSCRAKLLKGKEPAFVSCSPSEAAARMAVKKLAVIKGVERLKKTGVYVDDDDKDGFCYATSPVVVSEFRRMFLEHGLALSIVECQILRLTSAKTTAGFTSWLYTILCKFALTDVDTGFCDFGFAMGQGESIGAFSIAAAQTVARRTFLLNTFMVETYDDPEAARELKGKLKGKMETPPKDELQTQLVDRLYEHFKTLTDGRVLKLSLELEIYRVLGGRWPSGEIDLDTVKSSISVGDIAPGFKTSETEKLETEMGDAFDKALADTKGRDNFDDMFNEKNADNT